MKHVRTFALVVIALLAIGVHYFTARGWMTDDAYISYRYADNLAYGRGLVFNSGEHVEGYSNFLWVVLNAAGIRMGISPETSSLLLSVSCAVGMFLVIVKWSRKDGETDEPDFLFPALVFASLGNFWIWTFGGGLETILFTFLSATTILGIVLYAEEEGNHHKLLALAFLGLLATLTRPEGLLTFSFALGVLLYKGKKRGRVGSVILWFAIPFLILLSVYLAWKYWYFGNLLPNTFYAKVDVSGGQFFDGLKYSLRFMAAYPLVVLFTLLAVLLPPKKITKDLALLAYLLLYTGYVCYVGGDFMHAFRFFVPLVPLISILCSKGIVRLLPSRNIRWFVLAVTIFFSAAQSRFHSDFKWEIETYTTVKEGKRAGKMIAGLFPPTSTIAVTAAGAIPYFSGLRALDMLGLTNWEIAHHGERDRHPDIRGHLRSDSDVVFREEPDLIMFGDGFGHEYPLRKAERDVFSSDFFRRNYVFTQYGEEGDTLRIYVLNHARLKSELR